MPFSELSQILGNFGEFIGAIAVVVTLGFLALQLRHNTRALDRSERAVRAATSFEGAHSWAELNSLMMQDKELAILAVRSLDPNPQEFGEVDFARLALLGRSTMERLDGLFYLYRNGQLESELWEVRVGWARRYIETPFWREWWATERNTLCYSPSFVEELERQPADDGPVF